LKHDPPVQGVGDRMSPPVREAWIETRVLARIEGANIVASRAGGVD